MNSSSCDSSRFLFQRFHRNSSNIISPAGKSGTSRLEAYLALVISLLYRVNRLNLSLRINLFHSSNREILRTEFSRFQWSVVKESDYLYLAFFKPDIKIKYRRGPPLPLRLCWAVRLSRHNKVNCCTSILGRDITRKLHSNETHFKVVGFVVTCCTNFYRSKGIKLSFKKMKSSSAFRKKMEDTNNIYMHMKPWRLSLNSLLLEWMIKELFDVIMVNGSLCI
jgi:hypothetical protein